MLILRLNKNFLTLQIPLNEWMNEGTGGWRQGDFRDNNIDMLAGKEKPLKYFLKSFFGNILHSHRANEWGALLTLKGLFFFCCVQMTVSLSGQTWSRYLIANLASWHHQLWVNQNLLFTHLGWWWWWWWCLAMKSIPPIIQLPQTKQW